MKEILKEQRLLGITLLFVCLFNYPLLSIFDKSLFCFGIPVMYLYIFSIWFAIILIVAWITERTNNNSEGISDE